MNTIYELPHGRKVMIYMENNRILLLFTPLRPGQMPVVRHNDCLGWLFSAVWQGHIYYVYENFGHQILFGCLDQEGARVVLSPVSDRQMYEAPVLHPVGGQLYLFYQQCFENAQRRLFMADPWHPEEASCLWEGAESRIYVNWYELGEKEFMALRREGKAAAAFVWCREDRQYQVWEAEDPSRMKAERDQWKAKWDQASRDLEKAGLREAQWKQEGRELKRRLADTQAKYASTQAQLASAKTQYDQLAQTARQLQKIGKHWRDKYMAVKDREA